MYTTCVIWLAFVPLYFGTANHVALRITSMSVTISLNVRQSMMPIRYSAINKSNTHTGSTSMMAPVMVTAATCDQKQNVQKHVSPPIENIDDEDSSTQTISESSPTILPAHKIGNNVAAETITSPPTSPKINNNHMTNGPATTQPQQYLYPKYELRILRVAMTLFKRTENDFLWLQIGSLGIRILDITSIRERHIDVVKEVSIS
nr:unnamed protein product [Callosobruchus analis]